jgi:hypothetical protein
MIWRHNSVVLFLVTYTIFLICMSYATAAYIAPHVVLNHIKGENGADFRIEMHDMRAWNASISNTGSVNLTNIKVIINKKEIQEIRNLDIGKQEHLILLQLEEFPSDNMLSIISDQGAKEEIELSHGVAKSSHWSVRYNSTIIWLGLILIISSVLVGVKFGKKRRVLLFCLIIFFIGMLILLYGYLPSPIS